MCKAKALKHRSRFSAEALTARAADDGVFGPVQAERGLLLGVLLADDLAVAPGPAVSQQAVGGVTLQRVILRRPSQDPRLT